MAVDMESGTAVTLGDGSLAAALRATMSIPAVFTPVELKGRLLTDGGTLNNLPTEAAKAMGADVVIAVDLHSWAVDRDSLRSLIGILGQKASITVRDDERRSLTPADVVRRRLQDFVGLPLDAYRLHVVVEDGGDGPLRPAAERGSEPVGLRRMFAHQIHVNDQVPKYHFWGRSIMLWKRPTSIRFSK